MTLNRLSANDPRTVARDIPGIFDMLFPQLTSSVVAHFNRKAYSHEGCEFIPGELVDSSDLSGAMLFELAYARGEQLITNESAADWDSCLKLAVERQQYYFDAELPGVLTESDKKVAAWVAKNMALILNSIQSASKNYPLVCAPKIPGYQWIASGVGDFSVDARLVEVKCTSKRFSASDYRQIVMYWLLSYASSIEHGTPEWTTGILLNPRLNFTLELSFNEIIAVIGAGRTKIEILELFSTMLGDYAFRMIASLNE